MFETILKPSWKPWTTFSNWSLLQVKDVGMNIRNIPLFSSRKTNKQMSSLRASTWSFGRCQVATGRTPNIEGLGLEAANVECSSGGVKVKDDLTTSNPDILALGDASGATVGWESYPKWSFEVVGKLQVKNFKTHGISKPESKWI